MADWKVLGCLENTRDSPVLLVNFSVQGTAYAIHLTDLVHLWTETLDRKAIVRRSFDLDTSIDPSEGPQQTNLLLEHIRQGLSGEHKTDVTFSSMGNGKELLELSTKSTLPPPLNILSWKFYLKLSTQNEFSKEVLLPIIGSLLTARSAVSSLLDKIREKDDVIGRINTEFSGPGRSIAELFRELVPPKTSKDSVESTLAKKLPGLQRFDQAAWQEQQEPVKAKSVKEVCEDALRPGLTSQIPNSPLYSEPWWEDLGSGVQIAELKSNSAKAPPLLHHDGSTAFETRDSSQRPDNPASSVAKQPREIDMSAGNETDSDATASDLDQPVLKSPPLGTSQPPKKMGMVGGRQPSKAPSPPPASSQQPPRKIGMLGGRKPSPPPATTPQKRPKSPDTQTPPPAPQDTKEIPSSSPLSAASTPATKPKKKLGRIGGAREASPEPSNKLAMLLQPKQKDSEPDLLAGRPGSSKNAGSGEDEGSEKMETQKNAADEKADKRKEELNRQLEAKRQAPAKKKRRF